MRMYCLIYMPVFMEGANNYAGHDAIKQHTTVIFNSSTHLYEIETG